MDSVKHKTSREWWREVFSEKGVGSVKRVAGAFIVGISMACIIYLTLTAGPVPIVQDLLQTSLITGAALLGLYSITSIWKNGSMSVGGAGGKDITYSGEDSKTVLKDVLSKTDEQIPDEEGETPKEESRGHKKKKK